MRFTSIDGVRNKDQKEPVPNNDLIERLGEGVVLIKAGDVKIKNKVCVM